MKQYPKGKELGRLWQIDQTKVPHIHSTILPKLNTNTDRDYDSGLKGDKEDFNSMASTPVLESQD